MAEDAHKLRMRNMELESKSQAYSQFDYDGHKREYDENTRTIIERSAALEAEQRKNDDQIARFDQTRKLYQKEHQSSQEIDLRLHRSRTFL